MNAVVQNLDETTRVKYNQESDPVDWRENILLNTNQEDQEKELPEQQEPDPGYTMQDKPEPDPVKSPRMKLRPQRNRRKPTYLKDYV